MDLKRLMTCGRAVTLTAVSCAVLAASVLGANAGQPSAVEHVIPPGQEALIASMLGRGIALPDCTLVGCGVRYTVIEATYSCLDGDVILELGHPETAPAQTAQFAITVQSGTASPDLQNALVSLVRSREAGFVWALAEAPADAETDAAPE